MRKDTSVYNAVYENATLAWRAASLDEFHGVSNEAFTHQKH